MSAPEARPPLSAVPPAFVEEATAEQGVQRSRSSWPTTPLPACAMTVVVALAVAMPFTIHNLSSALVPVLLVPDVLATLAGRLVFESLDAGTERPGSRLHVISALAGSAAALIIMGGAALILGLRANLPVGVISFALGALTLMGAGCVRDLEIRLRLSLRRVFFAGSTESLRDLRRELTRSPEASLVGATGVRLPMNADALITLVQQAGATAFVIDGAAAASPAVIAAADALSRQRVRVRDLLSYYESEFRKVPLTELTPAWFLFEREQARQTTFGDALRRVTMTATAALMLLAAMPLLAVLALAVKLTSPGPAIFRQPRVGRNGVQFTLLKLRTMTAEDPPIAPAESDAAWATDLGHRITPLGRVLRRYRLDEIPQLWNVARGELALIGPRPEQVPIVERLEREIPYYAARHTVRPGLTGWAQVNLGYAGSLEGARAKLQQDLYYVKHRSVRLDLRILWLTVKAVFTDPS